MRLISVAVMLMANCYCAEAVDGKLCLLFFKY